MQDAVSISPTGGNSPCQLSPECTASQYILRDENADIGDFMTGLGKRQNDTSSDTESESERRRERERAAADAASLVARLAASSATSSLLPVEDVVMGLHSSSGYDCTSIAIMVRRAFGKKLASSRSSS